MDRASTLPGLRLARVRWNQDYADVAMAVGLMSLALVSAYAAHMRLDAVSVPLLILQTLPIALRRRNPMRILYLTGSAITVYSLLGYQENDAFLGVFVAFYTVAAHETRRRAVVAALVTAGGIFVSFVSYATFNSMTGWGGSMTSTYLSYGLAWLIGDNLRVRRAYTQQLEERAAELEREREEQADLAVSQERTRIARELHDVVAHYVSVMVVQAAGARRVAEKDPALARTALEAVEESGRTALAEMRRMLEVLRADTAGVGPQPGLAELDRLVGQVRDAGLPVEVVIEGSSTALPAGMDLAAYRIIQEALTNVVKHAGKATARVHVRFEADALDIEVTDDGRGAAAPLLSGPTIGGHGLVGMHERVALYEGTLEAGPVFPGGYRVHARFPLEPTKQGSRAECCDEESALSQVAADIERRRARQARDIPEPIVEPAPLVRPRVVPPLIGRVVPPHPTPRHPAPRPVVRPAAPRPAPQTQSRAEAQPSGKPDSSAGRKSEP
jgi:signal transduction histidine kinase